MGQHVEHFSAEKHAVVPEPDWIDVSRDVIAARSIAAIGFIFGTVAVVSLPFGLIRFHDGAIAGDPMVDLYGGPQSTSLQAWWLFISSILGTGLGLGLMIGCGGALNFRRWAWWVLVLWAIASLVLGICGAVFYLSWVLPPWRSHWAQVRGVVDTLVNLGGWFAGTVIAILMLIFLLRRRVKILFSG